MHNTQESQLMLRLFFITNYLCNFDTCQVVDCLVMTIIYNRISRHICSILINRPNKRNALNIDTIEKLKDSLREFEQDDSMHVAIIAGVGGNFCSGYDLNEFIQIESGKPNLINIKQMLWPVGCRLTNKKVTIAAIEGHAAGFGFELALKCDYRVADKDARIGFLNRRFGIPICNGGTVILPRLIGLARSKELIATGKAQLAPEALQYGTITYISDVGCAQGRSLNLARCLSKFHQPAMLHDLNSLDKTNQILDALEQEQTASLKYLENCEPLNIAARFLKGQLCRHGNTDLGNLLSTQPEVTL